MKWFFPLFSIYICATYNAAFSLYWVAANVASAGQTILFNKYFKAKEKKAAQLEEGKEP